MKSENLAWAPLSSGLLLVNTRLSSGLLSVNALALHKRVDRCEYCDTPSAADNRNCRNCGAPPRVYFVHGGE